MAKKKSESQRKHAVRAELTVPSLTKAGTSLDLHIFSEGETIGHLVMGRGSVTWTGGHRQKSKRMSWSQFAERMDEMTYRK